MGSILLLFPICLLRSQFVNYLLNVRTVIACSCSADDDPLWPRQQKRTVLLTYKYIYIQIRLASCVMALNVGRDQHPRPQAFVCVGRLGPGEGETYQDHASSFCTSEVSYLRFSARIFARYPRSVLKTSVRYFTSTDLTLSQQVVIIEYLVRPVLLTKCAGPSQVNSPLFQFIREITPLRSRDKLISIFGAYTLFIRNY